MIEYIAPWGGDELTQISWSNLFDESVNTDVEGLQSDGVYRVGSTEYPVFDVTEDEFKRNMEALRQRCRFTTEKVNQYLRNTRYRKDFFIRMTDESGKQYIRRVK